MSLREPHHGWSCAGRRASCRAGPPVGSPLVADRFPAERGHWGGWSPSWWCPPSGTATPPPDQWCLNSDKLLGWRSMDGAVVPLFLRTVEASVSPSTLCCDWCELTFLRCKALHEKSSPNPSWNKRADVSEPSRRSFHIYLWEIRIIMLGVLKKKPNQSPFADYFCTLTSLTQH